ncbi:LacI family DNA-binding transcriptional regulator [Microbacterium lacticum]
MIEELPPELATRIARRGGAATIYDIAELAGVNPSTVSRALSKPGRISARTEAKIRAAADRLNFQFNPMARALPTGRSHTIGLVVADITNPVIFGIVRGAERTASAAGYTLVMTESQESGEAEAEAISRLIPSVDGIVLATTRLADAKISTLAERKPIVLINRNVAGLSSVLSDVEGGVDALMDHLAGLGHTSVVYLSGPETSWISRRRWECLLDASERLDVGVVEIGPNSPTISGGREVLRRVLAARPTAVIAFNDLMAIGFMQAAADADIRVPDEVSVAGFDDIFGSELIVPALTTVRAQLERAGERAVEQLLAKLDDTESQPGDEPLATTLIVRGSTATVRGRSA